ncbi:PAS domain S-box protein [Yeosuana marina]|uniref:PAS domain-containing sensor histidine kinase n=1 Tax=Yeosuana marina TaxID=1565536 RepID=UPI0030C81700
MKRIRNSKYSGSLKISLIYLLISSIYIIFSGRLVTLIFGNKLSVEMLTAIEIYKGLGFVFVTSIILFVLIQRETKAKRNSIHQLELQKENLLNLTEENEKVKTRLQSRNIYIETILKHLPIGLAVNKIDEGDTIYMNKNFTKIYGWLEKELDNPDSFFKNVYPDEEYRKTIKKRVLEDINSGDPRKMSWEGIKITTSSGEKKIINAQNIPVLEQNLMISTVQDITKQKQAEETIRLNESILSASQKIAKVGGWQWDVLNKKMYWTDETYKIHDFEKNEFEMGSEEHLKKSLNCYAPEDRKMITKAFDKCIETGEKYEFIIPLKTAKGRNLWIHTSGEATLENGKIKNIIGVIQDITEIKQIEEKLRINEKRFRELVNNLNSGIVVHAKDTSILYSNPKAIELLGLNNEQLLGKQAYDPDWNFLHEDNKAYTIDEFPINQIINKKSQILNLTVGVFRPRTKDIAWLIVNGFPVLNNENEIIEVIICFTDITEQKIANTKLKESEEKYKLLAENTTDIISLLDADGRFLYVSPSGKNASGYEPNEILGKKSYIYFHPDDIPLVTCDEYWNKLKAGLSILLVYRFKSKDGKYKWFESSRQPVFNDKNKLEKIVSVSREITERVEREKVINNYQKSLKKLTTEISLTEEKQRKEIAANIHDHLSQSLVISKIKLNDLKNEITTINAQKELKSVIQYIGEALDNSRKITYDLCPPVLYEMGLIETMYWLAEKTQHEHHVKTLFTTDLNKIKLSESKLILIFRIIQELVNNTIKHAQAKNLKIEINVINELLEIMVSDDGKGFNKNDLPKAKVGEGGFGLFAVKERVQNLDGRISINSERNKGTTINISVPFI